MLVCCLQMDSQRSLRFVRAVLYSVLLSSAIANAQPGDRISRFDSKITVAKDRTLYVDEEVEITNDNGFLDRGFHRQLPVKAAGPQRTRAGSFQDIRASVDGSDALVRTTRKDEFWDVEISMAPAGWSRGKHLIELSYTAKHQFLVYDDFEDLNQNTSGQWPIPIDRASVELNFPSGIPSGASISADTASGTGSLFDCVRTNLPLGVRFDTSHSLEPNNRLFISARFYPRGYFVSNFDEDGVRAVLENHPRLYPWIAFFFGLIIFTSSAFLVSLPILRAFGGGWATPSGHRVALVVASLATALSGVTAILFHQPYTAMPGFWLGAIFSIMLSGNPHGGEPFSLVTVALASNFALYYLIARGLRITWPRRQDH